ncbi:MAG: hypothetical protein ABI895_31955 [Deltaproteobacteria bacterium]
MADSRTGFGFNSWLILGTALGVLAAPQLRTSSAELTRPGPTEERTAAPNPFSQMTGAALPLACADNDGSRLSLDAIESSLHHLLQLATGREWQRLGPVILPEPLITPVVVGLPDPRQSHVAIYYDQALVALRQAAAELGYVQDRFALPWQESPAAPSVCVRGDRGGALVLEQRTSSAPDLPGLMLFRNGEGRFLLAILVPESPVFGASVPQLQVAIELQRKLAGPDRPLAILGPTFSGSVRSYVDALETLPRKHDVPVTMVTGTATNRQVDIALSSELEPVPPRPPSAGGFQRTVPTDDVLQQWAICQISDLDTGARFAELSELGTGYGASRSEAIECPSGARHTIREFGFPLHVSELRLQHERSNGNQPELPLTLRRTLAIRPEREDERQSDIPKILSRKTAFSDELTLGQELSRICDERYSHLLIKATDPNDVVFLANQSRRYCHRPALVILGHEELFTHPDLQATFSGTLVVSAQPPSLGLSDLWNRGTCVSPDPFPNSHSRGFFNAVLALARAMGVEDSRAGQSPRLCVDAPRFADGEPWRLFLSQIAGSGIYPLRVQPAGRVAPHPADEPEADTSGTTVLSIAKYPLTASERAPRLPSRGARLLAWPLLMAGAIVLLLRALRRGLFAVCSEEWEWAQRVRIALAELSAGLILVLVMLPFAGQHWLVPEPWVPKRFGLLLTLGLPVLAGLAAYAGMDLWHLRRLSVNLPKYRAFMSRFREALQWPPSRGRWRGVYSTLWHRLASPLTLLGALAASGFVAYWFVSLWRSRTLQLPPDGTALVVVRLLNPFASSPATPLLCLSVGVFLWPMYALYRVMRLDRFASKSWDSLKSLRLPELRELWFELYWPWSRARFWTLAGVLVAFASWRILSRLGGSFEVSGFDAAFQCGFWGLSVLVAAEVVRFVTLSSLLIQVSRVLASQPMIHAYNRISTKVSGSFGLQLGARVPRAAELSASTLSSRLVTSLIAPLRPYDPHVSDLSDSAAQIERSFAALGAGRDVTRQEERAVHDALFAAAGTLYKLVDSEWQARVRIPSAFDKALDPKDLLPAGPNGGASTFPLLLAAAPPAQSIPLRAAEDFIALRISTLVYQVLHELRHTLTFALLGAMLLVLAVASYPFSGGYPLQTYAWLLMTAVVLVGLCQMLALERNELLSRIGGSRPDHIEWSGTFVRQIVVFVALPLMVVLFGVFPGLGDALSAQLSLVARVMSMAY